METYSESIKVNVPLSEAFRLLRDFDNFPSFMQGDAEITNQVQDRRIEVKNVSGTNNSSASITFGMVDDNTTEISVRARYEPDGLIEGTGAAYGAVARQLRSDLERFKEHAEQHDALRGIDTSPEALPKP